MVILFDALKNEYARNHGTFYNTFRGAVFKGFGVSSDERGLILLLVRVFADGLPLLPQ
jgi:hypothetical protein